MSHFLEDLNLPTDSLNVFLILYPGLLEDFYSHL